jgi:hypothetical protein
MELKGNDGYQSSANMATKGGCANNNNNPNHRSGGRGGGGRGGFGYGNKGGCSGSRPQGSNFQARVFCQICGKEGHSAFRCYKRLDSSVLGPPQKLASSATTSYGVDTNWYMDSGAIDHITGELEKLTARDKYTGGDQVHAANGIGMEISHITFPSS